jgi:hypothetical protein
MTWIFGLLLLAVLILWFFTDIYRHKNGEPGFDPGAYSYRPSPAALDFIAGDDEIESIRLIRDETGLGLKDGRELYRHLKAQAPLRATKE